MNRNGNALIALCLVEGKQGEGRGDLQQQYTQGCKPRRGGFGGWIGTRRKVVNWLGVVIGWGWRHSWTATVWPWSSLPSSDEEEEFGLTAGTAACRGSEVHENSSTAMSLKALWRQSSCRPCQWEGLRIVCLTPHPQLPWSSFYKRTYFVSCFISFITDISTK